jgi:hypothetical protein
MKQIMLPMVAPVKPRMVSTEREIRTDRETERERQGEA